MAKITKKTVKNKTTKKKEVANVTQVISGLAKISAAITSESYLDDILKLIVTVTAEVMGSKICSLLLINSAGTELEVKATQSVSARYNKKANIKIGVGVAGKVAKTGNPITIEDVRKHEDYLNRDIAIAEKLCSLVAVPLIVKGKVIGVLNSYTAKPHKFTQHEIDMLTSVAHQSAIVIENFRLVVETKVIKEELETRKAVERAKGILMKRDKIDEKSAYNRIRKYSMNNRKSMREVSEAIILTEDMKSI